MLGGAKNKKMRYRIKTEYFENGRKEYSAYVKKGFFWFGLDYEGKTDGFASKSNDRNAHLKAIDLHSEGNHISSKIYFENIDK